MSRTTRRSNRRFHHRWSENSAEDIKVAQRDGKYWYNTQWHFKRVHEVGRACNRDQFAKLRKCVNYDDFTFDASKHIRKRKGIWWEIY